MEMPQRHRAAAGGAGRLLGQLQHLLGLWAMPHCPLHNARVMVPPCWNKIWQGRVQVVLAMHSVHSSASARAREWWC